MENQSGVIRINRHSLKYLFYQLKQTRSNTLISEIYDLTYEHLFNYIYPRVSSTSDTSILVLEVYRILATEVIDTEYDQSLLSFLERVADGCIILHSRRTKSAHYSSQARVYAQ